MSTHIIWYRRDLRTIPRGGSWFNLDKQASMYDSDGSYRRYWLAR